MFHSKVLLCSTYDDSWALYVNNILKLTGDGICRAEHLAGVVDEGGTFSFEDMGHYMELPNEEWPDRWTSLDEWAKDCTWAGIGR